MFLISRRIVLSLTDHGRVLAGLFSLVILAAALDIAVPFLSQHLIDRVIRTLRTPQPEGYTWLIAAAGAIFLATALTRLIRSLYNYRLFRTAAAVEDEVKSAAFANLLSLDSNYQKTLNTGEVVASLDRGGTAVFVILYEILGQNLVPPLIVFLGVVGSLLARNAWIAAAVVLPLPVYILVVSRFKMGLEQLEKDTGDAFTAVTKESFDIAANAALVKKFSQEEQEAALQRKLLRDARSRQFHAERVWALVENIQSCISTLGRVIVICAGGFLVVTRRCTVGDYVLFIALQDMVYGPVSQLSVILPKLRRNLSRCERLFEILDQRSAMPDLPAARELEPLGHSVEFRDVSFRYPGADRWTLRHVNLKIPAGSTVALIGKSGAGKSTLVNLLQRTFDPQQGSILIDGVDIRTVTQRSLRKQIAVVPQEVDLFSRTINENIAYGSPDADSREVEYAARIAQAHDFILRCGQGYQTRVGERGLSLSGGERQRIGIARAILRDSKILILDEATSHLDNESETLIQNATGELVTGRTSFIIAHRLSTIQNADMVVVFTEGGIEAVGRHEELWDNSPTYRRLYSLDNSASAREELRPAA